MNKTTEDKKKELQERREHLAHSLDKMKREFASKNHGDRLTIFGPIIDSLATAVAAQVMRKGSSSLLLSLRIALQGIESEKCKGGVIGKVLSSATKGVVDLVIKTSLANEDMGSREFFQLITQALTLITISVIWKIEQFNLYQPGLQIDEAEDKRKHLFGFELMLLLILSTGVIEIIVKNVAASCGANTQQQDAIARLMKALILILALLTGAKGNQATLKVLVLDLKDYLMKGLEDIQNFINITAETEKSGEAASAINIFIQQALASLQEEDFDTVQQAYAGALEVIQATPLLMDADIEKVTEFAKIINRALEGSREFSSRTTASLMI